MLSALLWLAPGSAHAQILYTIRDLGNPGGEGCYPTSLNNAGQAVGYYQESGGFQRAFVWSAGSGLIPLSGMMGTSSATSINDLGAVVGQDSGGPFRWTVSGGRQTFYPFQFQAGAVGINNSGTIAGTYSGFDGYRAYVWSPGGGFQSLGTLGNNTYSIARAIGKNGEVVGESRNSSGDPRAVLWEQTTGWRDLGAFAGNTSEALAINSDNFVVGDSYLGAFLGDHAFLWDSANGMRDLGTLTTGSSYAYGINDSLQIVGKASGRAFIWQDGQMRDLNALIDPALGWTLRQANAINEFGQITGYGYAPGGGLFHGFVLTPVPEPSSLVFGALVAAAAIRRFGRQR